MNDPKQKFEGGGKLRVKYIFLNCEPKYRRIFCLTLLKIAKRAISRKGSLLIEIIAMSKTYLGEDLLTKLNPRLHLSS